MRKIKTARYDVAEHLRRRWRSIWRRAWRKPMATQPSSRMRWAILLAPKAWHGLFEAGLDPREGDQTDKTLHAKPLEIGCCVACC